MNLSQFRFDTAAMGTGIEYRPGQILPFFVGSSLLKGFSWSWLIIPLSSFSLQPSQFLLTLVLLTLITSSLVSVLILISKLRKNSDTTLTHFIRFQNHLKTSRTNPSVACIFFFFFWVRSTH